MTAAAKVRRMSRLLRCHTERCVRLRTIYPNKRADHERTRVLRLYHKLLTLGVRGLA